MLSKACFAVLLLAVATTHCRALSKLDPPQTTTTDDKDVFRHYLRGADALYAAGVDADSDGNIEHSARWQSPFGTNVSLWYKGRIRHDVLRLTESNLDMFRIESFERDPANSTLAVLELDVDVSQSSKFQDGFIKFIVNSRTVTDPSSPQILHKIVSFSSDSIGDNYHEKSTQRTSLQLHLREVAMVECFHKLSVRFMADNVMDIHHLHSAHLARSRRETWHYDFSKTINLAAWNYDSYSNSAASYEYTLYDTDDWTVTCQWCYYRVSTPISVSFDWGPGWFDFHVDSEIDLSADTNIDLVFHLKRDWTYSWTRTLLSVTPLSSTPMFSALGIPLTLSAKVKLEFEVDLDVKAGLRLTGGFDAHATAGASAYFDNTGAMPDEVGYQNANPTYNFNAHGFSFDNVDTSVTTYLNPIIQFELSGLGWVGAKAKPGLTIDILSNKAIQNECSSGVQYDLTTHMDFYLDAQAQVGIKGYTWDSDVYSYKVASLGPYQLWPASCLQMPSGRRRAAAALPESDASPDSDGSEGGLVLESVNDFDPSVCNDTQQLTVGETVSVDTCKLDGPSAHQQIHSQCRAGSTTTNHAAVFTIDLTEGQYIVNASGTAFDAVVQARLGSCSGRASGCSYSTANQQSLRLAVAKPQRYFIIVSGASSDMCGNIELLVDHDPRPQFFVDCKTGKSDASGRYGDPFASIQQGLDAVAAHWQAEEEEATLFLMPDLDYSCFYHPPPSGYVMPRSLRGKHITISSLNGADMPATALYNAHLQRCEDDAELDGTISTCLDQQQFGSMAYGTAYDTRLHPENGTHPYWRAFVLEAGDIITFSGLSFYGFAADTDGGAILTNGADVHVENCVFVESYAEGLGGAISVESGSLSVTGSVALGSRAKEGAFVSAIGQADVTVTTSIIEHGDASAGAGGAILVRGRSSLRVTSSTIAGNSAETRGGGICIEGRGSKADIESTSFITNDAGRYGGAVAVVDGASLTTASGVDIERNLAGLLGGGVAVMGKHSKWTDEGTTIDSNASPSVYVLDRASAAFSGTSFRHNSPIGVSDQQFTSTRPGALMCAYGSVDMGDALLAGNSYDVFGNLEKNIACVDCSGCSVCDSCSICGRCTKDGCDEGWGDRHCRDTAGPSFGCDQLTGHCVDKSNEAQDTTSAAPPSGPEGSSTSTSTAAPCDGGNNRGTTSAASGKVHQAYRTATIVLSLLLGAAIIAVTMLLVARHSEYQRQRPHSKVGYALYTNDDDAHDNSASAPMLDVNVDDSAF